MSECKPLRETSDQPLSRGVGANVVVANDLSHPAPTRSTKCERLSREIRATPSAAIEPREDNYVIKFVEVPNNKFARKSSETLMDHILYRQPTYRWAYQIIRTIDTLIRAVTHEHTRALQAATKSLSPRQSLPEVRAMYLPTGQVKEEVTSAQITNAEQVKQ